MKNKIITLTFIVFGLQISVGQIDFNELNPGPAFSDARNGSIASGDIDNDGDIDIVISGRDGNQLKTTLYANDGFGNFTIVQGISLVAVEFGDNEFADVDQDGDLDLLISGANTQPVYFTNLYLNDGQGVFTLRQNTPFEPVSSGDVEFGDIDNDNDLDLMIVGYDIQGNGFSKLYQNDGLGNFNELTNSNFEAAKAGSIAFFDFDGDGDNDLIISGENNNNLSKTNLYVNNGQGSYTLQLNTPFIGVNSGDIGIADTDNDGDIDVIINGYAPSQSSKLTHLYLNDGSRNFNLQNNTNFPSTFLGNTEFQDFDNDGDMDLLVTGSITGSTFASEIFENTGSNNFIQIEILNPMYFTSNVIFDMDNDNDLDIVMVGINNAANSFKTRTFVNNLNLLSTPTNKFENSITIYPNPTTDMVLIKTLDNKMLNTLEIYSLSGQLINKKALNTLEYNLRLSGYQSGTYLLKLTNVDKNTEIFKIIKE
jgi:hypothetical protein